MFAPVTHVGCSEKRTWLIRQLTMITNWWQEYLKKGGKQMIEEAKEIKGIDTWDLETISEPDGYDMKQIPDMTRGNIQTLVMKINELTETVNFLAMKAGEI